MEERLINRLLSANIISHTEIVKIRYGASVLKSEPIKTLGLIVIFYMMGYASSLFFLMLLIMPLRMCMGGFHTSKSVTCFVLTLATYAVNLLALPKLPISDLCYNVVLFISILFILSLPLAPSSKRPIKSREKYLRNKSIAALLCSLWLFILLFGMHNQYLIHCGIWAFFIQALQITVIYANNKKKGIQISCLKN